MREHAADRHRLDWTEWAVGRTHFGEVSHGGIVKVQPALVAELHDRGPGDVLGDRGDSVESQTFRRAASRHVRETHPRRPDQVIAMDHAHRRSRQAVLLHERSRLRLQLRCDVGYRAPHCTLNMTGTVGSWGGGCPW